MDQQNAGRKRKRHTPAEVVEKLRDADMLFAQGITVAEVAARIGVSEVTFNRWRNQYGGMKSEDMKRLKQLEAENRRLKTIVADKELDIAMLKEIAKGEF